MKKFNFSRLFAAAVLVAGLVFVSCAPTKDATVADSLEGTWVDASCGKSYYKITETSFENYGENPDGTSYESYAGNTLTIVEDDKTSGRIFFKYTKSMNPDYSYSTTAPDVGKWYAVSYKALTANSVMLCGAGKFDANWNNIGKTSCATLDEAKEEYTVANGYFGTYSDCVKE